MMLDVVDFLADGRRDVEAVADLQVPCVPGQPVPEQERAPPAMIATTNSRTPMLLTSPRTNRSLRSPSGAIG
jgi:hypothetical protein